MTRRRAILIGIASGLVLVIAISVVRRDIDAPAATAIADRMVAQYRQGSGEAARNFGPRETRQWADGWEFRWRYRPCAEFASLRIWISRDGRRAAFAELPDCQPIRGMGTPPLKV